MKTTPTWKMIDGYRWPYRVSDYGDVQKFYAGKWRTLKPYLYGGWCYKLQLWADETHVKRVPVSQLVADAFLGGTPPGMRRVHKNGMMQDNSVYNIVFMTNADAARRRRPGNSRPVAKIDSDGNVVAFYKSQAEAARKNHISQAAINKRCLRLVDDPRRLDGYDYKFAEEIG